MIALDSQPLLWRPLTDDVDARPSLMRAVPHCLSTGANNRGLNSSVGRRPAVRGASEQVAVVSPQGTPAYADGSHAGATPEHLRLQKRGNIEAGWTVFTLSIDLLGGRLLAGRGYE